MDYLSDSNLKTCKLPELVEYLTNDLRYDFIPLLDFCSHLINEGEVEKDNVCTLLYYVSFVYSQIKKQFVLRRNLPKAEVLSNLYPEVYEQDEYVNKSGYWDFVFLSMILAATTPQIENINLDKLAHISVKYDCFNDVFVNLNNVYETRKRLAQRIIELKLKGRLNIVTKLNVLSSIQAATTLPWESVLNYFSLYVDDLSEEDKKAVNRARKVQRYLSQSFSVAEQFTGMPGTYVSLKETLRGFRMILDGECDEIPESCFLFAGTIDEVFEKAKALNQ